MSNCGCCDRGTKTCMIEVEYVLRDDLRYSAKLTSPCLHVSGEGSRWSTFTS